MTTCACGARTAHGYGYPDLPPEDRPGECLAARPWFESAASLLAEADPGPTPFLVSDLIVDEALVAIVGKPKLGKTWLLLDLAVSIVAGVPALGRFSVPIPGPVLLVVEEAGRDALHRRLSMMARGRAIRPERLAGLHVAANRRVRLDGDEWRERLREAATAHPWRLIAFDPFARVKGATDENVQREVGPVLDFLRELRDLSGAAVAYIHHTPHDGGRQRGSSDLESYYESKLTLAESKDSGRLEAEHREAEAASFRFAVRFDATTETVRVEAAEDEHEERVREYLHEHPDASANEVFDAVGGKRNRTLEIVRRIRAEGGTPARVPPGTAASESSVGVVPPPGPYEGPGTTAATSAVEVVPGSRNHSEPGLPECVVCEGVYVEGEAGSAPLTCAACVERRRVT